jgi:lambda family phage portal protein
MSLRDWFKSDSVPRGAPVPSIQQQIAVTFDTTITQPALPIPRSMQLPVQRIYQAAKSSYLTDNWNASTTSADTEIRSSLTNLRARSRALIRDSAYAKRAGVIVVNNVIGGGMGLQAQVKSTRRKLISGLNAAIEDAWKCWNRADYCHTGGSLHFADLERALVQEVFEAGEVFVRMHTTSFGGSEIPFALEMIESERVPHEFQSIAVTRGEARLGIEVDKYYRPITYWVRDRHPSDIHPGGIPTENIRPVPASEIIHLRVIDRWPQTRGMPWLHAVARKLNDMDGYSEAEITAARAAAMYLGWEENPDTNAPGVQRQEDGSYQAEIRPNTILRPPPGSKLNFWAPNRPNSALDPFMRYMLREVAAGVGVSYESLSRDYSQSNYSSSRLSLLDDRDLWRVLQMWFIRNFRDTVHRRWMQQAVFAGAIEGVPVAQYMADAKKFESVKYKPRGWSWVDPTKEVEAFKEALKAGFTTRTAIIAQTASGADIEDVDQERREELDNAAELDLEFDTDPGADQKVAAPAAPKKSEPEKVDDEEPETPEEGRQMRLVK